jgi:hypothetical protein
MEIVPKYPIYVPSYKRHRNCYTAKFFIEDKLSFYLVVEPSQLELYKKEFPAANILVLPKDNMKLLGTRKWIREHSEMNGFLRHWQFDDNIRLIRRLYKGKRIRCNSNIAIRVIEDFTDRYENIGISGFNYQMFVPNDTKKPFVFNCHVYSASLILNTMPFTWRLIYNDDTDLCLQALTNNYCTVLFNAFMVDKIATMVVKGGNTDQLYQGEGRLKMARTLESMWPGIVTTKWRFGRPQHVIKNSWKDFKTPLIRKKDIDWDNLQIDNYGMKLTKVEEIKSKELKKLWQDQKQT